MVYVRRPVYEAAYRVSNRDVGLKVSRIRDIFQVVLLASREDSILNTPPVNS